MESKDVNESALFQVRVRKVLCTIIMMQDAIEITAASGENNPFEINKKNEFRIVKKLYRDIYKPKGMSAAQVDEVVDYAIKLYNAGHRL